MSYRVFHEKLYFWIYLYDKSGAFFWRHVIFLLMEIVRKTGSLCERKLLLILFLKSTFIYSGFDDFFLEHFLLISVHYMVAYI